MTLSNSSPRTNFRSPPPETLFEASSQTSPRSTPSESSFFSAVRSFFINSSGNSSATSNRHDVIPQPAHFLSNTYGFSNGLGVVEVIIALLVLANPVNRWLGLLGGLMAFTTPLVTLSFLITTPEAWVPALGDAHHGFPYLSGAGRLVLKDTLMLAGAVMIMADSAREILKQRSNESSSTLKTEY